MNAAQVITSLELPQAALVEKRVPKKLLLENGAPTAADRKQINEGIEELQWLAALKPVTIAVPVYRNEVREYLEVAVLRLECRPQAKLSRRTELVHRAVPYPLLLVATVGSETRLSLAHKRWAQNDPSRTVLDGEVYEAQLSAEEDGSELPGRLVTALAIGAQPRANLHAFYQGWIDALVAYQAGRLTGAFTLDKDETSRAQRLHALRESERLESQLKTLRLAAKREKQMARQVELNLEIKRVESDFQQVRLLLI